MACHPVPDHEWIQHLEKPEKATRAFLLSRLGRLEKNVSHHAHALRGGAYFETNDLE